MSSSTCSDAAISIRWLCLACSGEGKDAQYQLVEAQDPNDRFEKIVLSSRMIPDHLCPQYIAALESILGGNEA